MQGCKKLMTIVLNPGRPARKGARVQKAGRKDVWFEWGPTLV